MRPEDKQKRNIEKHWETREKLKDWKLDWSFIHYEKNENT